MGPYGGNKSGCGWGGYCEGHNPDPTAPATLPPKAWLWDRCTVPERECRRKCMALLSAVAALHMRICPEDGAAAGGVGAEGAQKGHRLLRTGL